MRNSEGNQNTSAQDGEGSRENVGKICLTCGRVRRHQMKPEWPEKKTSKCFFNKRHSSALTPPVAGCGER